MDGGGFLSIGMYLYLFGLEGASVIYNRRQSHASAFYVLLLFSTLFTHLYDKHEIGILINIFHWSNTKIFTCVASDGSHFSAVLLRLNVLFVNKKFESRQGGCPKIEHKNLKFIYVRICLKTVRVENGTMSSYELFCGACKGFCLYLILICYSIYVPPTKKCQRIVRFIQKKEKCFYWNVVFYDCL